MKPLHYQTAPNLQTAKTLELQIIPFCFLLRVICCFSFIYKLFLLFYRNGLQNQNKIVYL